MQQLPFIIYIKYIIILNYLSYNVLYKCVFIIILFYYYYCNLAFTTEIELGKKTGKALCFDFMKIIKRQL